MGSVAGDGFGGPGSSPASQGSPLDGLPLSALGVQVQGPNLVIATDPSTVPVPLLAGLPGAGLVSRPEAGRTLVLGMVGSQQDTAVAQADFAIGQLRCQRFLALAKTSLYWMSPRWGSTAEDVPVETQFLLLETGLEGRPPADSGATDRGGPASPTDRPTAPSYALLLPLIEGGRFRATLRPPRSRAGQLVLRLESGSPSATASSFPSALLVAAGRDPFELVARGVRVAARLSGIARPRADKAVPPSADVFGWCSWDAFYSMVSAAGIAEGLRSLSAGGVPPRLLIVDDGWQCTDVDEQYRALAAQRSLVGQVSVPHSQSEVELEDAVVDLVIGPGDERETNTRHAVLAEEDEILSFTPRALTPRQAAAANPFAHPHSRSVATLLLSPRGKPSPLLPLRPRSASPRLLPEDQPARQSRLEQEAAAEAAGGVDGWAGSPLQPPPSLPRISAKPPPLDLGAASLAVLSDQPAAQHAAEPAALEATEAAEAAAEPADEEPRDDATPGLVRSRPLWDHVMHAEATGLRMLKAWLDSAPSDSWRFRAFSAAATSLMRPTLLRFYARATEHTRRLAAIEANAKFGSAGAGPDSGDLNSVAPAGSLGSVIEHLKQRYGLRFVFMWHALAGFWAGVAPGGATAKYCAKVVHPRPTPGTLELDPSYAWVQSTLAGVGLPADPRPLHADMHAYLKGCGVDGVKVDVQGLVAHAGSATQVGGPALAAAFHMSLEDSAAATFGSAVINCMCGSTENLYNMRDTNLGRVSDDFYPRNRASFTTHISTCAFNSLFCGEIHVPDWDMFHSKHEAALLHATARAVSGGPVYISDKPGQHDFDLLRRLVLPDGSVPRCLLPGRPTVDCLFRDVNHDGTTALKVWNMNRCGGVVAAFNVQGASWSIPRRGFAFHGGPPEPVTACIKPADVPGLVGPPARGGRSPSKFAVWVDGRQELLVLGGEDAVELELAPGGGCDVLTLAAIQRSPGGGSLLLPAAAGPHGEGALLQKGVECAPLGLVNLLNAGGAVLRAGWAEQPTGAAPRPPRYCLTTAAAGTVLLYSSVEPVGVEASGGGVHFLYDRGSGALRFDVPPGMPLSVDWVVRF